MLFRSWVEVPPEDWRTSHFSDAFTKAHRLLTQGELAGWPLWNYVEALGSFGNEEVIPALREMAASRPDRTIAIENLLAPDSDLLKGEPKPRVEKRP